MRLREVLALVLLNAALTAPLAAQTVRSAASVPVLEPPVPTDPLELVTGDAQPITDPTERAKIIDLLIAAHRNSNVRAQPYDLKTSFTVTGSLSAGQWQEQDTSRSGEGYRWTVEGPGYSFVTLTVDRVTYSNQASAMLPLRLMQVREAIFKPEAVVGSYATLRTANANLNGADLLCALVAHNATARAATGGRRWEEQEWCVDPNAGTVVTFSAAPGQYLHYDYSKGLRFNGKQIPNGFTITQAGQTIIEAQTDSVAAPTENAAAFQPASLNQLGVGPVMSLAVSEFRMTMPRVASSGTALQIVALHGMMSPTAELSDVEVLASSDSSLNEAALGFVKAGIRTSGSQEGAAPLAHEITMILKFAGSAAVSAEQ
jgi:hypothetical protein